MSWSGLLVVLRASFVINIVLLTIACGGSGGSSSNEPPDNGNNEPPDTRCNTSLDSYIEDLHNYIPSWEEIECFTDDLQRVALPSFGKRMLDGGANVDSSNVDQAASDALARWNALFNEYNVNISSAMKAGPPYTGEQGETLTYPLTEFNANYLYRGSSLLYLKEKLQGRPIVFAHFYPIDDVAPNFANLTEFQQWVDDRLIPEKVIEAQAAERVKAEYYIPFPIEFEIFFKKYTQYDNGGFMDDMPAEEIIAIGQNLIDQIFDAVRPHFNGALVAHSYNRAASNDDFLSSLSYSDFDIYFIALFPNCDLATTADYIDNQLNYYLPIITRDGLAWQASEITVFPQLFEACEVQLADIEAEVYELVFSKLENAEVPPIGVQIGSYTIETDAAKDVIKAYFNQK